MCRTFMKDTKYSNVLIKITDFESTFCLEAHRVTDLRIFMAARVVADPIITYLNETYNPFTEMFSARNQPNNLVGSDQVLILSPSIQHLNGS